MAREINLLPQKKLDLLQQDRTIAIARGIAAACLVLVLTASLAVFFLNRDTTLDNLKTQETSLRANFALLHDKTAKNYLLLDRVTKIQALTKKKTSFIADITTIQQIIPSDVQIDTFSINKTSLSMSISSTSLISLGKFMDGLSQLVASKSFFKKATIDNAVGDEKTGKFVITVKGDLL